MTYHKIEVLSLLSLQVRKLGLGLVICVLIFGGAFLNTQHARADMLRLETAKLSPYGCKDTNRSLSPTRPFLRGTDVKELQLRLQELGYQIGPADGVYGPNTINAVKKFQKRQGLPANGIVNELTWKALSDNVPVTVEKTLPPPGEDVVLIIDLDERVLTVYAGNKVYKKYPVAIGEDHTPSPVGDWKVVHKGYDWGGGFGTRWLGLSVPWGIYGIHGTNMPWSIGRAASHGCFRMHNQDVEELFPWVQLGTKVKVVGTLRLLPEHCNRTLVKGMNGSDVVAVQKKLQDLKLYWGSADGIYGSLTEISVKYFQSLSGLPSDGAIGPKTKKALKIN